jgi:ribosomal protein S18 acetylase RimI-like enzyme
MSYVIRPMNREELGIAVDWAAQEGWNPGLFDVDSFYKTDPNGFLMGFLDDEPIASISAVSYDRHFGFIGFYIVKPEHRGKGYGYQLWQAALQHLPTQNIGLDGVVAQQDNYKKSGFGLAHRNIRYEGVGDGSGQRALGQKVVMLEDVPFDVLLNFDNQVFPTNRQLFLRQWIEQPESLAVGYMMDGRLRGYGMVRKCQTGYKVGPLFADNAEIAEELFLTLRQFVGNEEKIYLDVPQTNQAAVALAEKYKMSPIFETARMYTKQTSDISMEKIFGITTFELG